MLINRLKVQGFRGFKDEVTFDFTSPLTVIHAANGTGKTSTCDAVEWLLSGSIKRIQEVKDSEIRCQFSDPEIQTLVEVDMRLRVNGAEQPATFQRLTSTINKSKLSMRTDGKFKNLKTDVLSWIAPEFSTKQRSSQAAWLYSTRFLESNSLSLLIDKDSDASGARKLIFSNLFGVRDQQEKERQLLRVIDKLRSDVTLNKDLQRLKLDISGLEDKVKKIAQVESKPLFTAATQYLEAVSAVLPHFKPDKEKSDVQTLYTWLEVKVSDFEFQQGIKVQAVQQLKEQREGYFHALESKSIALSSLDSASAEVAKNTADRVLKDERLRDLQMAHVDASRNFASLKLNQEQLISISALFRESMDDLGYIETELGRSCRDLAELKLALAEVKSKVLVAVERAALLKSADKTINTWLQNQHLLSGIAVELTSLNKENPESLREKLLKTATEIQEELSKAQVEKSNDHEDLGQILSRSITYVEGHPDSVNCPACDSSFENNQSLLRRLENQFEKLSESAQVENRLMVRRDRTQRELDENSLILVKITELSIKKTQVLAVQQQAQDSLRGLDIKLVENVPISETWDHLRAKQLSSSQELEKLQAVYTLTERAVDRLEKIGTYNVQINFVISQTKVLLGNAEIEAIAPSEDKIKYVNTWIPHIEAGLDQGNIKISNILAQIKTLEDEMAALIERGAGWAKVEANEREKLNALSEKITRFESFWKSAFGKIVIENSEQASQIIDGFDDLASLRLDIAAKMGRAKAALSEAQDIQKQELEKSALAGELTRLQYLEGQTLTDLKIREELTQQVLTLQSQIKSFVSNQIKPITNIISTLYIRAQGNRFITSIESQANDDGNLDWIANIGQGGKKLDNILALSQGQRQDLALAIFLARARSLGGTFFLDEPLVHLDDLNRVALLDSLRTIITEKRPGMPAVRLIVTTASANLVRHLKEKFSLVKGADGTPPLTIYEMEGNPEIGVKLSKKRIQAPHGIDEAGANVNSLL